MTPSDLPHEKWRNSKTFHWFSALLILLLSCALIGCEYFFNQQMLSRDGSGYLIYAHEVLTNGWQNAAMRYPNMSSYPPLLVLLMYWAGLIGIDCETAGRALNIIGMVLTAQGVLVLCRELYRDKFTALLTAAAVTAMPKMYIEGCDILRDPLFWAEITFAAALIVKTAREGLPVSVILRNIILLAILCSLAVITRKEGVFFAVLAILWLLILFPSPTRRCRAVMLGIFLLLTPLPALLVTLSDIPWQISTSFIPETEH